MVNTSTCLVFVSFFLLFHQVATVDELHNVVLWNHARRTIVLRTHPSTLESRRYSSVARAALTRSLPKSGGGGGGGDGVSSLPFRPSDHQDR